jgi:multidrug resistance efflux pump
LDIPREPPSKKKRYVLGAAAIVAVVIITAALSRLKPAAPSVDRATLWIDTVRQGQMVVQVRGPGTLVPEQIQFISATTGGRVEQIHVRPGTKVEPNTLILEMTNPDVQLEALSAEQQLNAAEAALVQLKLSLQTQKLAQEAVVATARANYQTAKRQEDVALGLDKKGLMSPQEVGNAKDQATEAETSFKVETQKLDELSKSVDEQLALQREQVERLRAIAKYQRTRVESMKVHAGAAGVLQDMDLQPGQWVQAGTLLCKVAQPGRLKAVLRIPETQAKDIQIGQVASVDTRNGIVPGHVIRVDPSVQNGTVTVDVGLEGKLPPGARPDLSVDGTVEIERLKDVMYVGRPAYGQAESTVGLFRLSPDGSEATRVNVKLGKASVNTIVVEQGLNVGDRVIISDMSNWDSQDRVRLK